MIVILTVFLIGQIQIFQGICHKYYFRLLVTHGPCCSRRCSRIPHCSPSTGRCSGKPSPSGSLPPTPLSSSQAGTRTRRRWSSAWCLTWSSATLASMSPHERSAACTRGSAGRRGPGGVALSSTEGRTPGLKYVRIRIWSAPVWQDLRDLWLWI